MSNQRRHCMSGSRFQDKYNCHFIIHQTFSEQTYILIKNISASSNDNGSFQDCDPKYQSPAATVSETSSSYAPNANSTLNQQFLPSQFDYLIEIPHENLNVNFTVEIITVRNHCELSQNKRRNMVITSLGRPRD